jgi:hypothetical protein
MRVLVQPLSVLASASQPGDDGGLTGAEDPLCSGWVQSFGQREIRTMATFWEGVFSRYKGVLRRARERGMAGLTPKRLDWFGLAMLAVANQGVDMSFSVAEVRALGVGTSEPFGVYAFG